MQVMKTQRCTRIRFTKLIYNVSSKRGYFLRLRQGAVKVCNYKLQVIGGWCTALRRRRAARRLRPRTAQMHTFDGDRFNKLTRCRHGDDHSFTPLLVMMFWIIIEKLWCSKPLITTFGKTMPFGSVCDEKSSRNDNIYEITFCM